jgi:hypothetical protein
MGTGARTGATGTAAEAEGLIIVAGMGPAVGVGVDSSAQPTSPPTSATANMIVLERMNNLSGA